MRSVLRQGAEPAWDFTGLLQNYAFGDVLKFAVYCKDASDSNVQSPCIEA